MWILPLLGIVVVIGAIVMTKGPGKIIPEPSATEKRRIAGLIPPVALALTALRNRLLQLGIGTHVGSTRRVLNEQEKLVQSGASATMNSWHLLGRAIDLYPLGANGQADTKPLNMENYRIMHREAVKFGFKGLAFNPDGTLRYITVTESVKQPDGTIKKVQKKKWDGGHLEYTNGLSFAQAQNADKAKGYA